MPWTLYRYILKDVLKLLVFSTSVLLTVVSFAAAIRPYREGLLGATQLAKFLLYLTPTMLEYVLPLTAAFSTTMVFLRMASDNEVLACRAAGMSYRKILAPMFALAMVLMMGMFYLSNTLVPEFYQQAKQTVRRDAISLLMAQLSAGKPFREGDWVLYADRAVQIVPKDNPDLQSRLREQYPNQMPDRMLVLDGAAVASLDEQGRVHEDGTAERAVVVIFDRAPDELGGQASGDTGMSVRLINALRLDEQGRPQRSQVLDALNVRIPGWESGDLSFFTLAELQKLDQQPDLYEPVRLHQLKLAQALAKTKLERLLVEQSNTPQGFALTTATPDGQSALFYRVKGPGFKRSGQDLLMVGTPDKPIVIEELSGGGADAQIVLERTAETLLLTLQDHAYDVDPTVTAELTNVKTLDPIDRTVITELSTPIPTRNLIWPERLLAEKGTVLSISDLRSIATDGALESGWVSGAAGGLKDQLDLLKIRVKAEIHNRVAASVSCGLLTLLGTLMAMRSGGKMPLVVYFWAFLMAIASVLLMNTGENLVSSRSSGFVTGIGVLWSGNALLFAIAAFHYRKLSRW